MAADRLRGAVHHTPVLTSRLLDARVDAEVLLKAEHLQATGSFKIRGAYNAVTALQRADPGRSVVTFSSGNHAQAVARAAQRHGIDATIVMPDDAPLSKRSATEAYGAQVVTYDRETGDRAALAAEIATQMDAAVIPPFDHPDVIAGQSTVAQELLGAVDQLDLLVVPVGGGGLISGCALAAHHLSPATRVIGVEPATGDDARRSLEAGRIIEIAVPDTIADGQQVTAVGVRNFEVIQRHVTDIVTVTDDQIVEAMDHLFRYQRQVVEPSGASALAALLAGSIDVGGRRVGVVLSGGNIDPARFFQLLQHRGSR